MTQDQFESTTKVVWAVLEPWLKLHFGEKCEEFEFGCECCERWKLAEELLAFDRVDSPEDIRSEIQALEDALRWRKQLLEELAESRDREPLRKGRKNAGQGD